MTLKTTRRSGPSTPLVPCSQTIEYLKLIARAALQQRSGTISNILTEVRDHSDWTKPLQYSMSGNLKGHEVISSAPFNGNNGQYVGSQSPRVAGCLPMLNDRVIGMKRAYRLQEFFGLPSV